MFLKQSKSRNGRILLSLTHGYWENGKVKHKNIETFGYLDDLAKLYDDPITYFRQVAKQKTLEFNNNRSVIIEISNHEKLSVSNCTRKNLGYCVLKRIYNELNLNDLFRNKQSKLNIKYNLNDIFQLLIYSRILYPGSKKETFDNKNIFFDDFDFSLKDLYRSLDHFNSLKENILASIWSNTKDSYNRDTSTVYYDCTNYYFEIFYNDEDLVDENGNILEKGFRKKGSSKEHRPEPIVQMGLLMDKNGIPLSYNLFPGNESEKTSLRPALKATKNNFNLNRVITVADRGLNTSDNTIFIAGINDDNTNKYGYVFGQSILGADKEFKDFVLKQDYITDKFYDEDGNEITFIHKSRIFGKQVQIVRNDKRTNKVIVYQKQMVYYSEKYAHKQKKQRDLVLEKAKDLINNPGKYTRSTSIGAAGYINNYDYDKKTGEIITNNLSLNLNKIKEEEQFDGYYSIVTSEKDLTDKEIRDIYKGLWKIEESFKITKSNLESRPVYVWTKEHIEAHFLTCFVSLVIIRLLEQKMNRKYSTDKIIKSLKNYSCSYIKENYYLFDYRDDILIYLEKAFNVNFDNRVLNKQEIKKILNSKK